MRQQNEPCSCLAHFMGWAADLHESRELLAYVNRAGQNGQLTIYSTKHSIPTSRLQMSNDIRCINHKH